MRVVQSNAINQTSVFEWFSAEIHAELLLDAKQIILESFKWFDTHTRVVIMISKKREAINAFKMMISSSIINHRQSSNSVILQIKTEDSKILFHNVISILDLIIDFEMKSDRKIHCDV